MVEVTLQDLKSLVEHAVDAGIQAYEAGRDPAADRMNQAQVKRFLKANGIRPSMLAKWVDARLVTPQKSGDKQNSSVYYSLAQVKNTILLLHLKNICNN